MHVFHLGEQLYGDGLGMISSTRLALVHTMLKQDIVGRRQFVEGTMKLN